MWKGIGIALLALGTIGVLYSWMEAQKNTQTRIEELIFFLRKTLHVMQSEKIKILDYFSRYIAEYSCFSKADSLVNVLTQVTERLSLHIYPNGQKVWEEVLKEHPKYECLEQEAFQLVVQAGNGLFGRSKAENISFLQKSIQELEQYQLKLKEKDKQERKVWIPVGMLGTLMVIILFL